MKRQYLPGASIGVMGGGQLGRMFAMAARRIGYRVHIFSPEKDGPAAQLADQSTVAEYGDEAAVRRFAGQIDVLTFEFENIPVRTVEWCAESVEVRPSGFVLHTAQNRLREKDFLKHAGIPVASYRRVDNPETLSSALAEVGGEGILKSAAFGYDGKGQQRIQRGASISDVWADRPGDELILEESVDFQLELSAIVSRGEDGRTAVFPLCENHHANHVLDVTVVPARVEPAIVVKAAELAKEIAEQLGLVGILAVEMFLTKSGDLLVNELAPRPHNSGHWTIEGCVTSQFEQHLRAVCGLPLGEIGLLRPCAMANLLGDVWAGGEPRWDSAMEASGVNLHLYGKKEPRKGRKMGHLTALAATVEDAVREVKRARAGLCPA